MTKKELMDFLEANPDAVIKIAAGIGELKGWLIYEFFIPIDSLKDTLDSWSDEATFFVTSTGHTADEKPLVKICAPTLQR